MKALGQQRRNVSLTERPAWIAPAKHSSRQDSGGPADESRNMVKSLHGASIKVVLDGVFSHSYSNTNSLP